MHRVASAWLMIEPAFAGHRFSYLQEIVRGAFDRGVRVTVAVGDDAQGNESANRLGRAFPGGLLLVVRVRLPRHCVSLHGPLGLAQRNVGWWRFLARAYREALARGPIDFVFVPYLDDALFAIGMLGSPFGATPFAGVTMRQRFHLREMGVRTVAAGGLGYKERLFVRFLGLHRLRRVFVIDDTLPSYFERRYPPLHAKLSFIPDPIAPVVVTPRATARERLALPADATIVLAYGYLDARKGIGRLMEWAAGQRGTSSVHVLLAGAMSADVEQLVAGDAADRLRSEGRLHAINRYVEAHEEHLLFSAADAVWLVYEDIDLMSGVLVTAAYFRKAVLFADHGLIGRYAKLHGSQRDGAALPRLPPGVELRFFEEPARPLPDHSWANACRRIFEA